MNKLKLTSFLIVCFIFAISINVEAKDGINFQAISLKKALAKAEKENKLVFIDISTSWCPWCKHLSKFIFPDKELGEFMNANFISIKLDGEKGKGKELWTELNLSGFPALVFLSAKKDILEVIPGAVDAVEIIKVGEKAMAFVRKESIIPPINPVLSPPISISPPTTTPPTDAPFPITSQPVKVGKKTEKESATYTKPLLGFSKIDSVFAQVSKQEEKLNEKMSNLDDRVDKSEQKIKWYLIIIAGALVLGFIFLIVFSRKTGVNNEATDRKVNTEAHVSKATQKRQDTVLKGALKDESGVFGGGVFIVKGSLSVGREKGNGLQFPTSTKDISRNHAILKQEGLYLFVTDLGSTNGTSVNDEKITSKQPFQLHSGDKISFGKKRFGFSVQ